MDVEEGEVEVSEETVSQSEIILPEPKESEREKYLLEENQGLKRKNTELATENATIKKYTNTPEMPGISLDTIAEESLIDTPGAIRKLGKVLQDDTRKQMAEMTRQNEAARQVNEYVKEVYDKNPVLKKYDYTLGLAVKKLIDDKQETNPLKAIDMIVKPFLDQIKETPKPKTDLPKGAQGETGFTGLPAKSKPTEEPSASTSSFVTERNAARQRQTRGT